MFGSKIGKRRLNSKADFSKQRKEKSSLFGGLEVTLVKTLIGYRAFLAKQEEIWGNGQTKAEALGKMIEKHPEMFGLAIQEKKRPNPLRDTLFDETDLSLDYKHMEEKLLAGLKIPKEMFVMSTPTVYGESPLAQAFEVKVLKSRDDISFAQLYNFSANNKTNFSQEYQAQFPNPSKLFIDSEHSLQQDDSI